MTVDDQAAFRRAAHDVIEATTGFRALGDAECGESALALAAELDPDLILIDVRMPGMDGVETARRLAATNPRSTIVLVSTECADDLASVAGSCGAVALLPKQDFGTAALRRLWDQHGGRASAHGAGD
jgi:DNA-binding NarL/FixJ family response regulator